MGKRSFRSANCCSLLSLTISEKVMYAFTKWVPPPERMTLEMARKAIDISLRVNIFCLFLSACSNVPESLAQRMKVASLDMLQFHWWGMATFCRQEFVLVFSSLGLQITPMQST